MPFHQRIVRYAPEYVVLLITFGVVAFILRTDVARLVEVYPDDCGYYLAVARNAARGHGLTFDGIHATNGFHPLWMAILVAMFRGLDGSAAFFFRFAALLNVALVALGCILFHRILRAIVSPVAALAGGLVCCATAVLLCTNLMESAVVLVTLCAVTAYGLHFRVFETGGVLRALCFGFLLGLSVLARLDLAIVASIVLVSALASCIPKPPIRGQRKADLLRLLWILLGVAAVDVPYLTYNYLKFGSAMPISGQLKSSFPHPSLQGLSGRVVSFGGFPFLFAASSIVFLGWYLLARRREPADASVRSGEHFGRNATAILCASVACHYAHEGLFMMWASFPWHFALAVPLLGSVVAILWQPVLMSRLHSRGWQTAGMILCVAYCAICMRIVAQRLSHETAGWHGVSYRAALRMKQESPPAAVFAMKDSGLFGYFSERRVVNLDGVIANMDLQNALLEQRLGDYLGASGVQYIVQHAILPGDTNLLIEAAGGKGDVRDGNYEQASLRYRSQRFGNLSDSIRVSRANEVYRSPAYAEEGQTTSLVIWRIESSTQATRSISAPTRL